MWGSTAMSKAACDILTSHQHYACPLVSHCGVWDWWTLHTFGTAFFHDSKLFWQEILPPTVFKQKKYFSWMSWIKLKKLKLNLPKKQLNLKTKFLRRLSRASWIKLKKHCLNLLRKRPNFKVRFQRRLCKASL